MLSPEEEKDLDEYVARFKKSLERGRCRMIGVFFALAGWVMWHHWTPIAATVAWTLAVLMLIASFTMPKK